MRSRIAAVLLPLVLVAACGTHSARGRLSASAGETPASDDWHGVSQSELQDCIASSSTNCEESVPGVSQCLVEYGSCNKAAYDEQVRLRNAAIAKRGKPVSRDEAEAMAVGLSVRPAEAKVVADAEMTYGEFLATRDGELSPIVPKTDTVFVISVAGPVMQDGSLTRPEREVQAYGVVIDAEAGRVLEMALGSFYATK